MSADFPVVTRYEVYGAQDVIQTNAQLWRSFEQGKSSVKDFNKELRTSMESVNAESRYLRSLSTISRVQNYEVMQLARTMTSIGTIGGRVLSMWQAYTIGMIRVEQAEQGVAQAQLGVAKAHKKVEDAQREVSKWQKLYNQYLRDFGADSAITKNALDGLHQAEEYLIDAQTDEESANLRVAEAMEKAARVLEDLKVGYASMMLQLPSFAADLIRVGDAFSRLLTIMGGGTGVLGLVGSKLAGLAGVTGLTGAGVGVGVGGGIAALTMAGATAFGLQAQERMKMIRWEIERKRLSGSEELAQKAYTSGAYSIEAYLKQQEEEAKRLAQTITTTTMVKPPTRYTPPVYESTTTQRNWRYTPFQFGTPYVPETGAYILHKGERVLTERESRTLKQTGGNNFKVTLNVYPPPNTTDPEAIAQYTLEKMKKWFATGIAM